jgi:hypothetical protein
MNDVGPVSNPCSSFRGADDDGGGTALVCADKVLCRLLAAVRVRLAWTIKSRSCARIEMVQVFQQSIGRRRRPNAAHLLFGFAPSCDVLDELLSLPLQLVVSGGLSYTEAGASSVDSSVEADCGAC